MPVDLSAVGKKLGAVTHTYSERDLMLTRWVSAAAPTISSSRTSGT
jgi:hypothetical protein